MSLPLPNRRHMQGAEKTHSSALTQLWLTLLFAFVLAAVSLVTDRALGAEASPSKPKKLHAPARLSRSVESISDQIDLSENEPEACYIIYPSEEAAADACPPDTGTKAVYDFWGAKVIGWTCDCGPSPRQ